jgi:hypothetical protein
VADLALFGGLALAAKSESASTFCALLAWGYVAATLVNGGQSLANTMVKKVSTLNTTAGASGASAATAAATPSTVPFIGPPAGQ